MTLETVTKPVETRSPRVVVFGRVVTREQALRIAAELHRRRDYKAGLRALDDAGLTIHDLVEWSERASE